MSKIRINRALAMAGVASRRQSDELVRSGLVQLNGQIVTALNTQVDPRRDQLAVRGQPVKLHNLVYYLYHKPRGQIATMTDEHSRPCVGDVCRMLVGSPRPVGRLDRASEGLMLLTNDGELANRLLHPRYAVRKRYLVTVEPQLSEADARRAVHQVALEDGPARLLDLELVTHEAGRSRLAVTVAEGRNRLIRRLFEALGYEVKRLKRVQMGPLSLGKLALGKTRQLAMPEVANLRAAAGLRD